MDTHEFEAVVREAIAAFPPRIREELKDVVIVIEDRPQQRGERGGLLLGLYQGVPLTEWGRQYSGKLPDKITIFREPIERVAASEEEIPRVIRETVWHEIAHYFGFDHEQIRKMERRWRKAK